MASTAIENSCILSYDRCGAQARFLLNRAIKCWQASLNTMLSHVVDRPKIHTQVLHRLGYASRVSTTHKAVSGSATTRWRYASSSRRIRGKRRRISSIENLRRVVSIVYNRKGLHTVDNASLLPASLAPKHQGSKPCAYTRAVHGIEAVPPRFGGGGGGGNTAGGVY
jgi:hypothetical protein